MCPVTNERSLDTDDVFEIDYVEAALAWHDGDARAAIATLIEDCRHLRQQLVLAGGLLSRGMGRGWQPVFERSDDRE